MSEIQDDAYSEALAEIERLKRLLQELSSKEAYKEWQRSKQEILDMKSLLSCAADALENWHTGQQFEPPPEVKLIAELRKAAQ
jgi:hypothetical protein